MELLLQSATTANGACPLAIRCGWKEWEQQMKTGHPVFDEWLASRCDDVVHGMGARWLLPCEAFLSLPAADKASTGMR
jgi:hypothetical protein